MATVEMLSAKIYKRRDPKKAILTVTLLLVLAFGACLFIPKQWITDTVFFCNLMVFSVYGTSVFFFSQERKRWKAVAAVIFAAAAVLELFMFVRFNCGYDIFLVGRPSTSIPILLSSYSVAINLIRVVFYRILFLLVIVVFSYVRYTGRKQWWGVVVPASVVCLLCNVVYIVPQITEPGADAAIVNQLVVQLLEHCVFAGIICITAVLLDWICSFNAKPLYMKTGAVIWAVFGFVLSCGAAAFLTMDFLKTLTGAEYILCTVIAAASFVALLVHKRAGVSICFYAVAMGIAASIGVLINKGDSTHLFIALVFALLPAATWLILSGSWQSNAPAKNPADGRTQESVGAASPVLEMAPAGAPNGAAAASAISPTTDFAVGSSKKDSKRIKKQKQKEERERQKQSGRQDGDEVPLEIAAFKQINVTETHPNVFCGYCGAVLEADARFCKICGKSRMPVDAEKAQKSAIEAEAAQQPGAKKIYVETDNRGTMHKDVGQATSYWVVRRPAMQTKPPYLLYVFRDKKSARQALLDISYIHTAVDTGGLICDYLMEYGFYEVVNDDETVCYEAVVCGHDLTVDRYSEAKASFEKHNGVLKSEQAPDPNYKVPQGTADMNAIVFKEEFVDNGRFTYRVHFAPNRATAIEFLRQSSVDQEYVYIVVDTPEGSFGRDIDGMYEV